MDQQRIDHLLKQYAAGALTGEEQQELEQVLAQPARKELEERISALLEERGDISQAVAFNETTSRETFDRIIAADKPLPRRIKPMRKWLSAAAVALLCISAGGYFLLDRAKQPAGTAQTQGTKPEKSPGRNAAILYLADNSAVELDSLGNGILAAQGGASVVMKNGQLSYLPQQPGDSQPAPAFNRIVTPRGGEFTIVLPDGTRVWLNAASSLTFPTVFSGAKREVELTGEAYLQVAEDRSHPFEVKIRDVNVAVVGTQFNIMGYEDESGIVTTLVTGSVRITAPGNDAKLLAPGQHAVVDRSGALRIEKADVAEETAWKNGRIHFERTSIRQIMRQVSRWYDVDIAYRGNVADMDFTCTVSRRDKLSKLLALLEMTGAVHFTMEGNTIVVQP